MSIADYRLRNIAGLVLVAALLCACGQSGEESLLDRAYQLGEQYRWREAMPLVKAHLIAHPGDPAGHYLLGRCYLHDPQPFLVIAEGELRTALHAFQRIRDHGALARHMSAVEFEAAIYRELARSDMRRTREAMNLGFPPSLVRPHLERALEAVRQGRAIAPDDPGLREMEETLEAGLHGFPGEGEPSGEP
ncbi:MAG TPA: hypothetical protein ENN65_02235 [Candidatus Hydrogenedentes bacterium]|nr:hypothetical protein [Candidatus Hydrogenedentota bacterium]